MGAGTGCGRAREGRKGEEAPGQIRFHVCIGSLCVVITFSIKIISFPIDITTITCFIFIIAAIIV